MSGRAEQHRIGWCSCHGYCCVPLCAALPPHHEGRGGPWATVAPTDIDLSATAATPESAPVGPDT